MSISSCSSGASGMGASSSSFDASAMAHSTGSSGAGSGSVSRTKSPVACSSLTSSTAPSVWARKRPYSDVHTWFMSNRSVTARAAHSAAEDGQIAWLQVGRAVGRDDAQHDVKELRRHGDQGGLAGVERALAGAVPARWRLSCPLARSAPACPTGHGPC